MVYQLCSLYLHLLKTKPRIRATSTLFASTNYSVASTIARCFTIVLLILYAPLRRLHTTSIPTPAVNYIGVNGLPLCRITHGDEVMERRIARLLIVTVWP